MHHHRLQSDLMLMSDSAKHAPRLTVAVRLFPASRFSEIQHSLEHRIGWNSFNDQSEPIAQKDLRDWPDRPRRWRVTAAFFGNPEKLKYFKPAAEKAEQIFKRVQPDERSIVDPGRGWLLCLLQAELCTLQAMRGGGDRLEECPPDAAIAAMLSGHRFLTATGNPGREPVVEPDIFYLASDDDVCVASAKLVAAQLHISRAAEERRWRPAASAHRESHADADLNSDKHGTPRFEDGIFRFEGVKIRFTGLQASIIELLADGRPKRRDQIEAIWDSHDRQPEAETIRSTISRVRSKLCEAFGLAKGDDPIPCLDRSDASGARKMDLELLARAAKKLATQKQL